MIVAIAMQLKHRRALLISSRGNLNAHLRCAELLEEIMAHSATRPTSGSSTGAGSALTTLSHKGCLGMDLTLHEENRVA